jgi:hypothetical protein
MKIITSSPIGCRRNNETTIVYYPIKQH